MVLKKITFHLVATEKLKEIYTRRRSRRKSEKVSCDFVLCCFILNYLNKLNYRSLFNY